jgi:hypothetical protein
MVSAWRWMIFQLPRSWRNIIGWKIEELQRWLGDCLVATLLDPR